MHYLHRLEITYQPEYISILIKNTPPHLQQTFYEKKRKAPLSGANPTSGHWLQTRWSEWDGSEWNGSEWNDQEQPVLTKLHLSFNSGRLGHLYCGFQTKQSLFLNHYSGVYALDQPSAIDPFCSSVSLPNGMSVSFIPGQDAGQYYPDDLFLLEWFTPETKREQQEGLNIGGGSLPEFTDLENFYGGNDDFYKFDFKPGHGDTMLFEVVVQSAVAGGRIIEQWVGGEPTLKLQEERGIEVLIVDAQGQSCRMALSETIYEQLLANTPDGDEFIQRLKRLMSRSSVWGGAVVSMSGDCQRNRVHSPAPPPGMFLQDGPQVVVLGGDKDKISQNQKTGSNSHSGQSGTASGSASSSSSSSGQVPDGQPPPRQGDGGNNGSGGDQPPPGAKPEDALSCHQEIIDKMVEDAREGKADSIAEVIRDKGFFLLEGLHSRYGLSVTHVAVLEQNKKIIDVIRQQVKDDDFLRKLWFLKGSRDKTPDSFFNGKFNTFIRDSWLYCLWCQKRVVIPYRLIPCIGQDILSSSPENYNYSEQAVACQRCLPEVARSVFLPEECSLVPDLTWLSDLARALRFFVALKLTLNSFPLCAECNKTAVPPYQMECCHHLCTECAMALKDDPALTCKRCGKKSGMVYLDFNACREIYDSLPSAITSHSIVLGTKEKESPTHTIKPTIEKMLPPDTERKKKSENAWLKLQKTYWHQGVLARIVSDRKGVSIEDRIANMKQGTVSFATHLLPNVQSSLMEDPEWPVFGFLFSPDIKTLGRFSQNAFSLESFNEHENLEGYNHLIHLGTYRCLKNHINLYSFMMKLYEQSLRKGNLVDYTSGHIDDEGAFQTETRITTDKLIDYCESELGLNEVIIEWGKELPEILGIVIYKSLDCELSVPKRFLKALSKVYSPEALMHVPVVLYQGCGFLKNLGSLQSFHDLLQLPDKIDRYKLLQSRVRGGMLDTLSKAIRMCTTAGQCNIESAEKVSATLQDGVREDFTLFKRIQHEIEMQLSIWGNYFGDIDHITLPSSDDPVAFGDYIDRLIDFSFAELPRSYSEMLPMFYGMIFFALVYRQLLEQHGITFTEEEVRLIPASFIVTHLGWNARIREKVIYSLHKSGVSPTFIARLKAFLSYRKRGEEVTAREHFYFDMVCGGFKDHKDFPVDLPSDEFLTLKTLWFEIDKFFHMSVVSKKDHFLDKSNRWLVLLTGLKNAVRHRIASELRGKKENIQRWPYAEMMINLPDDASLLELVHALVPNSNIENKMVGGLTKLYAQQGLPRYFGTLRGGYVTRKTTEAIKKELEKSPGVQQVADVPRTFNVQNMPWENPVTLQFPSPLEGMDKLPEKIPSFRPRGSVKFKGIPSQTALECTPVTPEDKIEKPCMVCREEQGDSERVSVKMPCNHIIHQDCYKKVMDSSNKVCPLCRYSLEPILTGQQPYGQLTWTPSEEGKGMKFFMLIYITPAGKFKDISYSRDCRIAYIPDTLRGRVALSMLITAYKRGLVFDVGYSMTRQQPDCVTWKGIPHKTALDGGPANHGFPDETYVSVLIDTLEKLGIKQPSL